MTLRGTVVLLPGFGGRADQPILMRLSKRLDARGLLCHRAAPPRGKVTPGLEREVAWLEALLCELTPPFALVGRSFGGRIAIRLARRRDVRAVALLGFPLRPPGKPRPLDEAALAEARAKTLIVQGAEDELGPLALVRDVVRRNRKCELLALEGAGHSFGRQEGAALDAVAEWLAARMR
ncbi:MAG: alpha/beta family hydrolase [Myxococcota bacterium]